MLRGVLRRLRGERRGAQALEFVLVSSFFFPISFAVVELGFILWTQNAMQSAASGAARCAAIGGADCTNVASYASTAVGEWLVPDSVTAEEVTVTTATSCNGATGTAVRVSITHQFWSGVTLPWPFSAPSITVNACYPTSST